MIRIILVLLNLFVLFKNVSSVYISGYDNSYENIGNVYNYYLMVYTTNTLTSLSLNTYDLLPLCTYLNSYYKCSNLPIDSRLKSGKLSATDSTSTVEIDFNFKPIVISPAVYIGQYGIPTSGGPVIINGRFFDKLKYDDSSNNFQVFYRRVSLPDSSFTISNSTQITIQIPEGTGGASHLPDNPLYIRSTVNATTFIYLYYQLSTISSLVYDDSTQYVTLVGTNFGNYPDLISVYAGMRVIKGAIMITPHTSFKFPYDPSLFGYQSSISTVNSINGINGSSSYTITLPPSITSVSNPYPQGGNITILGKYLSNYYTPTPNYKNGYPDTQWYIYLNNVRSDYQSTTCPVIEWNRLICKAPAGNGNLAVYLAVNGGFKTETITVPYSNQIVSSITKSYYGTQTILTITGYGFSSDGLSINIGGEVCTSPQFISATSLKCTFSSTVKPNINGLSVSISSNTYGVTNNPFAFQYYPEVLSSATQSLESILISGNYFSIDIKVLIGSYDISGYCTTLNLTAINCIQIPNIPSGDINLIGAASTKLPFIFKPLLLSLSSITIPSAGSTITLNGKYFELKVYNSQSQSLSVLLNGQTQLSFTYLNSSQLELIIPPSNFSTSNSITVKSSTIVSDPISFSYEYNLTIGSVVQNSQSLDITGSSFKASPNIKFIFSTTDITSSCTIINDTNSNCQLSANSFSSYLLISIGSQTTSFKVLLNPVISSISKSILNTIGEDITISGNYFEQGDPTTGSSNTIKVLLDNSNEMKIKSIDSSIGKIVVSIISGFGSNHNLIVSINNNRTSNPIKFSYISPVINSVSQNNDQFSLDASYFSTSTQQLNTLYFNDLQPFNPVLQQNSLTFTIPSESQNGNLVLRVSDQDSNNFNFFINPVIKSVSPSLINGDGTTIVTISGSYFTNKNYKTGKIVQSLFKYKLDKNPSTVYSLSCESINITSYKCSNFKGTDGLGKLFITQIDGDTTQYSNEFQFELYNKNSESESENENDNSNSNSNNNSNSNSNSGSNSNSNSSSNSNSDSNSNSNSGSNSNSNSSNNENSNSNNSNNSNSNSNNENNNGSDKDEKSNKWKVPVIAAVCSVGGAGIIGATVYVLYKKRVFKPSKGINMRSF